MARERASGRSIGAYPSMTTPHMLAANLEAADATSSLGGVGRSGYQGTVRRQYGPLGGIRGQ